ncbi:calcium/proton exchanger [Obba rivulosa]|uniref:Vacuolar calcium ion transporter n=1 Tax=Obba rivulosa TaxID=1052685 RepID=A0A8E2AUV9_9APHY|nr:calcium/proton exchanger [Obba rivulosa]
MPTTTSDRTPLLENWNGARPRSFRCRISRMFRRGAGPSWLASYEWFILGSWLNVLLVFVPLSVAAYILDWDAALQFVLSFLAVLPLSVLLGRATDELSYSLGQTMAGLLGASVDNIVEIIVGVSALLRGEYRIVQTSLLGSILSNLLVVLGCSFLAGGLKYPESSFQVTAAQTSSSLMTLACITLVIPAAYHNAFQIEDGCTRPDCDILAGLLAISRGTAVLLLLVYMAYIFFQLQTHSYLFKSSFVENVERPQMNMLAASSALVLAAVITSFCADYLVASIDETTTRYKVPKPFVGLILLPIAGNAGGWITSVWMALKKKMETTIVICVGSSIQVAAFVIPLLIIIGWMTHHELTLFFANFETIVLFVSVILVNFLVQDGKSNYMEGLMLIALYLVIALAFWVS